MKQPLISIIIPVYNGEKYLRPCIDSILHQTYQHWELLLIDDGSPDSSGAICDEYASDPRISVVHKENGGQASARNQGVAMAKGEYISFVDCDDWIEADMYESMLQTMQEQQTEIIICGYLEEYMNRQKRVRADGKMVVYDATEAVKLVLQGKIGSYLWSMLFRREVVQERMPDLNPYEDHATIFKWISHAHRVVVLHQAFYHYRQLESSSLHTYNTRNGNHFFSLYLRGCIKLTKDLARMPDYDVQLKAIIEEVRDELRNFLPISRKEIGTKYYIRLKLLMMDVNTFVHILRMSSLFSNGGRRKSKGLLH